MKRHIDVNTGVIICCTIVMTYAILGNRAETQKTHDDVVANRAIMEANQTQMLSFMVRTVERWDNLQKNNPDMKVPKVIEPNGPETLSQKDMERKKL